MTFSATFRVRWVDTDNAGVMHFTNFLRYFEACEEEFYRSFGMTWSEIREKYRMTLPRVEAHCEYKAACRFDDPIEVTLDVREVAGKTITYDFKLIRKTDSKLAATGYIKCIAVDENWRPIDLPEEVAEAIRGRMAS